MKNRWLDYHKQFFANLISDSNSDYFDNTESRREMLLHLIIIVGVLFFTIFGAYSLIKGDTERGIIDLSSTVILLLAGHHIHKFRHSIIPSLIVIFFISSLFIYFMFSGEAVNSGHLWALVIPVTAPFLLGSKRGFYLSSAAALIIILLFMMDYPSGKYHFIFKIRYIGAYLAFAIVSFVLEEIRYRTQRTKEEKNIELENSLAELKEKDAKLYENSLRYKLLFEESNDAIIIVEDGKIIDCNNITMDLFGFAKDEIINQPMEKLSPKFQPDGVLSKEKIKPVMDMAYKNKNARYEWLHIKKDGRKFTADSNLHLLSNLEKEILFFSIRDITVQKEIRAELLKAKEDAEKSDRLKSEFLAQMSHEIRTPVNAIMNFSSLLKMDLEGNLTEDNLISFSAIENSAARLVRTINLILNMSEIETGSFEPLFVDEELVERILKPILLEFKHAATEKNITLTFKNELPPKYKVKLDPYTISHSIINLVDNAIKYTKEGEVVLHLYKSGAYIILDIIDTGIGISEEYLPNMFRKFSQEEQGYTRQYEGNGLGLALVKEYCKLNDADVQVESVKGSGSKFTIILNDR